MSPEEDYAWSVFDALAKEREAVESRSRKRRVDFDEIAVDEYVDPVDGQTHYPGCTGVDWRIHEADGDYVCIGCGSVHSNMVMQYDDQFFFTKRSSYKRIHHWNERINQFLCLDNPPPHHIFQSVREWFDARPGTPITKPKIREALRSMRQQKFVEKWIAIQCHLTDTPPPNPDAAVVERLRVMFATIERHFHNRKPAGRKSMINYNFLFVRTLQHLGQHQYIRFFPLLKSKNKIKQLDDVWRLICSDIDWPYLPLPSVKQFR